MSTTELHDLMIAAFQQDFLRIDENNKYNCLYNTCAACPLNITKKATYARCALLKQHAVIFNTILSALKLSHSEFFI